MTHARLPLLLSAALALLATAPAARAADDTLFRGVEDGGARAFTLTPGDALALRAEAADDAEPSGRVEPGVVLDNLGCEAGEAGPWCLVQPLGGGPVGFVAAARLQGAVGPDGAIPRGPDTSALRLGQGEADARGELPCARHAGQPTNACAFVVTRAGSGDASVRVTHPDGLQRLIWFRMGRAIGVGDSEASPAGAFSTRREADLTFVQVGSERYEIPDAVVLGG